jgi:hypothetical protein
LMAISLDGPARILDQNSVFLPRFSQIYGFYK